MGNIKTSKALARKELRKAHRQAAKEKKQQRHAKRAALKRTTGVTEEKPKLLASTAVLKSQNDARKKREEDGLKRSGARSSKGDASSNGVRKKKRWRPDEIDPMIAAEDAEIKRLERLLGITGANAKKKRAKLEKELEHEDGLGDDFGVFLAGLDRIGEMVEGGASGTSDDGGIDADWDFHENVTGDSGSGSNGEGGEHGLIDGGEADSEDVPGIDEEEGGGDEAKNVYDRKHRSNDTYKGLEKGRDKELEAEKSRRENKENMNAWPEENEDEDYDDEGENDGEDGEYDEEEENGGEDGDYDDEGEINGDGDDVYDHIEDEEHQKEQHTYQAKEEKRVSREEGIGGTKGNRTESTSEDDDDGGDESEDFNLHTYHPTPGQDIYGRPVDKGNVGAAPAKYVPPHLRASTGGSEVADSDKCQQVQRVINGIMNRLSEDTLEPVTARLKEVYRGNSTTVVNEALWQSIRAVCIHPRQVMSTLIPPFAAVIAALNISLGADVGGFFLETIARELNMEVSGETRAGSKGTGSNLLLILAYLYNYGAAHCSLVYDIIHLLVEAFGPKEMELLLLLLQHSGYQLRSDDSQALKQIVAIVKDKYTTTSTAKADADAVSDSSRPPTNADTNSKSLAEDTEKWKVAFGSRITTSKMSEMPLSGDGSGTAVPSDGPSAAGGSRARYILDTIVELQGNKRSRLREQGQESGRRVRKWLGSVKAAKAGGNGAVGDASLRVSWAELVSTESRGRWWKVGAAWTGRGSVSKTGAGKDSSDICGGPDGDDGEVGLLTLAARQRMNTDVRRSVFVAIMGSSDCEDALDKILRLNLKGAQEREIARVIIECCSQERSYNPFYSHLAARVCDRQPKLRFTFQVAFWDALKTLDEAAERRARSLARLMAHLVLRKQLSLSVLKTVEIPELNPSGLLLMRVFFQEIIAAGDDASFMEVFRRLARPPGVKEAGGHAAARDNTLVFLRGHLGSAPASWDHDKKKSFRKRVKGACRLIEAIVAAEELA